mmetsp:Transcript_33224/g.100138  ORF Transcript_33224/g.100138 Transcript_33224/m.100138 type:complete len:377 (-) Transcript_33224:205-1335(-)
MLVMPRFCRGRHPQSNAAKISQNGRRLFECRRPQVRVARQDPPRARAHRLVPRHVHRRLGQRADEPRLARAVRVVARTVRGRPPLRPPRHGGPPQGPGLRRDVRQRAHGPAARRRGGRLELRPDARLRTRNPALLPVVHDGAGEVRRAGLGFARAGRERRRGGDRLHVRPVQAHRRNVIQARLRHALGRLRAAPRGLWVFSGGVRGQSPGGARRLAERQALLGDGVGQGRAGRRGAARRAGRRPADALGLVGPRLRARGLTGGEAGADRHDQGGARRARRPLHRRVHDGGVQRSAGHLRRALRHRLPDGVRGRDRRGGGREARRARLRPRRGRGLRAVRADGHRGVQKAGRDVRAVPRDDGRGRLRRLVVQGARHP